MYIPRFSFSRASSRAVHSWSLWSPARTYALRSFPERSGAWPSRIPKKPDLVHDFPVSRQHPGNVHHLAEAGNAVPGGKGRKCCCIEGCPADIGRCRGHAGREHVPDIDRQAGPRGKHVLDPRCPGNVCDLVGIGDYGCRPVCRDEPGVFLRHEKRTLDMDMGVDKAGDEVCSRKVAFADTPVAGADANNDAVLYREIVMLPGTGECIEDLCIRYTISAGTRPRAAGIRWGKLPAKRITP